MKTVVTLWKRGALALACALMMALALTGTAPAQTTGGLSIDPDTLDFHQVKGGKFAIASFVLRNTMDSGHITGTVGSLGGVFKFETGGGSFDLGPGEFQVVTLRFTPSAPRLWTDSIMITHTGDSGLANPTYVYLRGIGRDTVQVGSGDSINVMVSSHTLNFGGVHVGQSSQRTVTLTNRSDSALLVGSISTDLSSGPYSITSGGGAFMLNAGETRSITVNFAPTVQGSASGQLMISYNSTDSSGMEIVNLQGYGIAPSENLSDSLRVMIHPDMINFGNVRLGQTSQRSFRIVNGSDSAHFMGTIMPIAGTSPFSVTGSGSSAINLSAGGSQDVTLQFAPTTRGAYNTDVVVAYMMNGTLAYDTVHVWGFGVDTAGVRGRGRITTTPETIDFGRTTIGSVYQRQITIANPSTDLPVTGTVMNPASPFYLTTGAGSFTLAPNESRTITLSYMPTLAGNFTDNLAVNYMGAEGIETAYVSLSGISAALSGVEDRDAIASREGYDLMQNRPNPFGLMTTIAFSLPKNGHAMLRVFNARGESVATLVDQDMAAGDHSVTWTAEGMESGVYFYQLQSGDVTVARQLTLTK